MMRAIQARSEGERGAAAVEMAIIVPVLVLMAFGMLEFGIAFKNKLQFSHAVNQSTRNATVMGTDQYADIEILNALEAGLDGDLSAVTHVDIFQADTDGSPLLWGRYVPDAGACGWTPCPDPDLGAPTYGSPENYKPCNRDIVLDSGGVDTIGVQVQYTHAWLTGVLGIPTQTWHETARARLEPDLFGAGSDPCP